jgi:hypothetical protein
MFHNTNQRKKHMKTKLAVAATLLSLLAIAFAQTLRPTPRVSLKADLHVLKIRSAGQVVAELRLIKPTQVEFDGKPFVREGGGALITQATNIYFTTEGQAWRLSGADMEVEISSDKTGK